MWKHFRDDDVDGTFKLRTIVAPLATIIRSRPKLMLKRTTCDAGVVKARSIASALVLKQ